MELIKCTFDDFCKWFQGSDLESKFPLISRRVKKYTSDQVRDIYKLEKDGEVVGITFCGYSVTNHYRIHLFEVNSDFHRQRIGTEFYKLLSEEIGDREITLSYAGNSGGEAHMFWKKMGFVQRFSDGRSHEMINEKYSTLSERHRNQLFPNIKRAKIRTVVKEHDGMVEIVKIDLDNNEQIS